MNHGLRQSYNAMRKRLPFHVLFMDLVHHSSVHPLHGYLTNPVNQPLLYPGSLRVTKLSLTLEHEPFLN